MANQTRSRTNTKPKKADDNVVFKVMMALVLLIFNIYMIQLVDRVYTTLDGLTKIYPLLLPVALGTAAVAVIAIVLALVLKNRIIRSVCPYVSGVFAMFALSAIVFRQFVGSAATILYILNAAVYCLFMIYQLYRAEFFLVSLATVLAGVTFYYYSNGFGFNFRSILLAVLLLLGIALDVFLAVKAGKNKGLVPIAGLKFRVFPHRFNPFMMYITCVLWLVCFLACLLLGATFAYYCMFAAIAFELIAAVYYTFQLK